MGREGDRTWVSGSHVEIDEVGFRWVILSTPSQRSSHSLRDYVKIQL